MYKTQPLKRYYALKKLWDSHTFLSATMVHTGELPFIVPLSKLNIAEVPTTNSNGDIVSSKTSWELLGQTEDYLLGHYTYSAQTNMNYWIAQLKASDESSQVLDTKGKDALSFAVITRAEAQKTPLTIGGIKLVTVDLPLSENVTIHALFREKGTTSWLLDLAKGQTIPKRSLAAISLLIQKGLMGHPIGYQTVSKVPQSGETVSSISSIDTLVDFPYDETFQEIRITFINSTIVIPRAHLISLKVSLSGPDDGITYLTFKVKNNTEISLLL